MAKYVIIIGLLISLAGLVLYFFPGAFKWIGNLPGDIRIQKENFSFYFPITTMIIISILLSLILRFFR